MSMIKKIKILFIVLFISNVSFARWDGEHYQSTCRPQYEMAQFAIRQLPKKEYTSILDIGCGSGDFTKELLSIAPYVVGVDYSASMIEKAKAAYTEPDNLWFQVEDIRELSGITQTFDLVLAFHPIQWIPAADQSKAFEQMARCVAPDGICMLLVSDKQNIFYKPLMDTVAQPKWKQYIPSGIEPWNWQTIPTIYHSFSQAGLHSKKIFIWYKKYQFDSKQDFFNFMENWFYNAVPFEYLSPEKRTELFNEVLEQFLAEQGYEGESVIKFESPFIIGIAKKE